MPFRPRCLPAFAGLLFTLSTVHCQAIDLPPSPVPSPSLVQGWTEQDRQQWYHTSAGTQLIPYDWFVALEHEPLKNSFARTGILSDPTHQEKLPVGLAKTEGPNVSPAQVGMTCAFCHTTQFIYQGNPIRIEGGPSLQYNQRFLQTLLESLGDLKSPDKFMAFATQVLHRRGQVVTKETLEALAHDVGTFTQALISRGGRDASPNLWGPGRFDALGRGGNMVFAPLNPDNLRPANASVSIPPLWGVWEYDWVQWAGSIQHPLARNIAQVIGVNAGLFAWTSKTSGVPSEKSDFFRSSVDVDSLKTLEALARRLHPPRWLEAFPPINRELAARGKDLYHGNKAKGIPNLCAHCHVAKPIENRQPNGPSLHVTMVPLTEIGTDSLYLENFSRRTVDTGPLGRGRLSAKDASQLVTEELLTLHHVENDPEYRHMTNDWRDLPHYIARPHLAVWATAPFLHNGSVPTLYELLSPVKERRACFSLSPNMEFDPQKVGVVVGDCTGAQTFRDPLGGFDFRTQLPGNGNGGHEFANTPDCASVKHNGILGCELPVPDRWAIVEYLKTCDLERRVIRDAPVCRDLE